MKQILVIQLKMEGQVSACLIYLILILKKSNKQGTSSTNPPSREEGKVIATLRRHTD